MELLTYTFDTAWVSKSVFLGVSGTLAVEALWPSTFMIWNLNFTREFWSFVTLCIYLLFWFGSSSVLKGGSGSFEVRY